MPLCEGGNRRIRVISLPHGDVFEVNGQSEQMQVQRPDVKGIGREALV